MRSLRNHRGLRGSGGQRSPQNIGIFKSSIRQIEHELSKASLYRTEDESHFKTAKPRESPFTVQQGKILKILRPRSSLFLHLTYNFRSVRCNKIGPISTFRY